MKTEYQWPGVGVNNISCACLNSISSRVVIWALPLAAETITYFNPAVEKLIIVFHPVCVCVYGFRSDLPDTRQILFSSLVFFFSFSFIFLFIYYYRTSKVVNVKKITTQNVISFSSLVLYTRLYSRVTHRRSLSRRCCFFILNFLNGFPGLGTTVQDQTESFYYNLVVYERRIYSLVLLWLAAVFSLFSFISDSDILASRRYLHAYTLSKKITIA